MKKIFFILGLLPFFSCGTQDMADKVNYDADQRDDHHDDHHDDRRHDHDDHRDDRDDDDNWW
jgi:hypothetical protein